MKITSVAALRRIPIGTRLWLVRCLMGPQAPSERIVKLTRSRDVVLTIADPSHKSCGESSYLTLEGCKVEPTDDGFRVLEDDLVCAEYTFSVPT